MIICVPTNNVDDFIFTLKKILLILISISYYALKQCNQTLSAIFYRLN